jgi:hypothetical protein
MRPFFNTALLGSRAQASGTVSISNATLSDTVQHDEDTGGGAGANVTLENDGDMLLTTSDVIADRWLIGGSNGSLYEARATLVSGTLSPGADATGSWLALSSNRAWYVSRSSIGTKTAVIDIAIGLTGTSTALDTARFTLTATIE